MYHQSDLEGKLKIIWEKVEGRLIPAFTEAYMLLGSQTESGLALRFFLENAEDLFQTDRAKPENGPEKLELMDFDFRFGTLVEGMLDHLMSERMEEDDFYRALWDRIQENSYWKELEQKVLVLYNVWLDGRIPYYRLPEGIHMEKEEFGQIIDKNIEQLKRIIFILNSKFSQRTEKSSSLMKILESLETEEDKAVILAQILAAIEKRAYLNGINKVK